MRHAVRSVFKQPLFSLIVIGTLALGIGLNVALFGVFNAMLFRALPVQDPGRLVALLSSSTRADGPRGHLTYPDFEALRARRDVLTDAFAFAPVKLGLSASGSAVRVSGQIVTTNMFDVLGVVPLGGRTFSAADDREPVAVASYDLWQRTFGGDVAAVGGAATINGRPFTIIGVAPRGFSGPNSLDRADLWIPLGMSAVAFPGERNLLTAEAWWLTVIGRLAPGADVGRAQAVLSDVATRIAKSGTSVHEGFQVRVKTYRGTEDQTRGEIAPVATLVLGVTLCVLLIACANVAALMLSRAVSRQREIGIRLALGATRGALARQLLSESLVLALAAGMGGLLAAMWGIEAIVRFAEIPAAVDSAPDWRVVLFTVLISLLAALAFGLTPALGATNLPLLPALRSEPGADARPRSSRLQRALLIGQLAMSLVMLASAGILIRGLSAAWTAPVGFQYADRVAVSTDVRLQNYDVTRAAAFYDGAIARVRALPGVESATLAQLVPFGGRVFVYRASLPDRPADSDSSRERVSANRVWTDFFSTLRIPIVRGRDFTATDLRPGANTAIISETMASRSWPERDAIGQRFSIDGPQGPFRTVVGIVRDVQVDEFTERPWSTVWLPHSGEPDEIVILAASVRPPSQVIKEIESVVRSIDRDLPLYLSRPLRAYVAERLDGERALSKLLTICGLLALGLAGLGLYGITAYGVTLRRREIGVRMALGAGRQDVLQLFVREGMRLAWRGVGWGILPAVAVTYALSGMFVGVFPVDAVTLFLSVGVLAGATLLAAYIPARRATLVDPLVALRTE